MWIKYLFSSRGGAYHEAMDQRGTEPGRRLLLILAVVVVAVGAVMYWFGKTAPAGQPETAPLAEPPQEFIPPAVLFQLSYDPASVALKAGKTARVTITVMPASDFNEPLAFRVEDILRGIASVKDQNMLTGKFAPASLAPADFSKGTVLSLSAADRAAKGLYVISFSAEARGDKKNYVFPISIE